MERLRQRAKKYRELGKEHAGNPDAPAVAVFVGDGEHAEWNKIALLLLREDIGKPLRHLEDYLNDLTSHVYNQPPRIGRYATDDADHGVSVLHESYR